MAQLFEEFSTDTLPQGPSFDVLPAGWYNVCIVKAEIKRTKHGTGQYIAIRYDVTGPTHQGRCVFGNLNIKNETPKAEEIGRQNLGDIMRAIGLARVTDTDQLIGGNLSIKLAIKQDDTFGEGNEVKGYKALEGSTLPTNSASPAVPDGKKKAPWAK